MPRHTDAQQPWLVELLLSLQSFAPRFLQRHMKATSTSHLCLAECSISSELCVTGTLARSSSAEGPERRAAASTVPQATLGLVALGSIKSVNEGVTFCAKRCSLAASRASRRCLASGAGSFVKNSCFACYLAAAWLSLLTSFNASDIVVLGLSLACQLHRCLNLSWTQCASHGKPPRFPSLPASARAGKGGATSLLQRPNETSPQATRTPQPPQPL